MQQITFNCQIITPMFLAGADGTTPELRPPSIKGALRFWWRAMNGHLTLEELRVQEGAIFGDTTKRSKVIIQTAYNNAEFKEKLRVNTYSRKTAHILNYLSYGTWDKDRNKARGFVDEGLKFDIKLSFQETLDEANKQSLLIAFKAFVAFGNLGMKMRNGFGSFKVTSEHIDIPTLFQSIVDKTKDEIPAFHAFSKKSLLFRTQKSDYPCWQKALIDLGNEYRQHNKIKWGQVDPRHAKSYFFNITEESNNYMGWLLFMPCQSEITNYESETESFNKEILESKVLINYA